MGAKVISMSLYGNDPTYFQGTLANIRLLFQVYPGWKLRVYCGKDVDPFKLKKAGCEVVIKSSSRIHSGMFWRFLAAWDVDVERVIFRDVDSRLNVREAAAVRAWEESGLAAHVMHDHPHHAGFPISGGMWGIKPGFLPQSMRQVMERMSNRPQQRLRDMIALRDLVQPLIQESVLRHSSVPVRWPSVPFPEHLPFEGFVGQQHDKDGHAIWP